MQNNLFQAEAEPDSFPAASFQNSTGLHNNYCQMVRQGQRWYKHMEYGTSEEKGLSFQAGC